MRAVVLRRQEGSGDGNGLGSPVNLARNRTVGSGSTVASRCGNLSRHIAVLEQAGLVEVEKGFAGKRTRTWVQATKAGRAALRDELSALRELLARVDG